MRAYFSRRYRLSASHRLHTDTFSEEQNRDIYGKCNNPYGHGHNYTIEVTVGGQVGAETGMVCDLVELDTCVQKNVIERFDHMNLNLDPLFQHQVPTTENLCMEIYELLADFNKAELVRVRIEETSNNSFEYPVSKR
ncbi:6-carboxytetrahydropterin synthase [Acidobacterium sp. S8]|uniref:6-carboxytetrahydropterin synthase n=1 Tax=Acidobacterium sp. S8 TaxID=1641854 RepID=UPI00131DDBBB|nr:6-carboxytetrahydropterin synthase [Acidobacterium sp. S8]